MITFFISLLNNLDVKGENGLNCLHFNLLKKAYVPKKLVLRIAFRGLILKI